MATLMFGASHSLPNPTINDLGTNSDSILAGLGGGAWGRIVHLEVNLTGLTHAFSDDLDFLFVGPNGAKFEFWSDAGGSNAISNGNFTISDSGAFLLPDGTSIASGTYRPSDYLTVENGSNWGLAPGVIINHPTPNGTATLDSVFGGLFVGTTNWSLYVKDDTMGDVGTLVNWGFHITYNLIVKPDDFNGNFLSDILWQNSDGTPAIWLMNGTSVASLGGIGPFPFNPGPSWQIKGTGDFNFDTKADILWQGADGTAAIWLMNGMNALAVGAVGPFNPGPSWQIKGTGDFNNDGRADILWQGSDGTPAIWLMDGMNALAVGAVGPFNPGPTWQIKGTGDFNNDGRADILWQGSDGTPAIWLMDGMNAFAIGAVGPFNPGPSWHVEGTGDYNLDARSDILWQSDDGTPAIWTMNGMNVISVGAAGSFNPGNDWHVIA
jgi:FG-GAP-like repeat